MVLTTPLRLVIVAGFTAIETAALAIWLGFVQGEPTVSTAAAMGLGVLIVGLTIEHILTAVAVNGLSVNLRFGAIVILSVSETILWGIQFEVSDIVGGVTGFIIGFVVLAVLLVPQHTLEDNFLQGRDLLSDIINLGTVGFSLVEALAATVWLALVLQPGLVGGSIANVDAAIVGLGVLLLGLFIEHFIGVSFSSR